MKGLIIKDLMCLRKMRATFVFVTVSSFVITVMALISARCGNIALAEGVYLQAAGPQYETPAEIRVFSALGADAVGMSTACEAVAAVHCGLRVCAVSCITNAAAGILPQKLSHEEVQTAAEKALPQFKKLLHISVEAISKIL